MEENYKETSVSPSYWKQRASDHERFLNLWPNASLAESLFRPRLEPVRRLGWLTVNLNYY